ncbi:MAG: carboxylate-amine ligase [Actinomycetota bacterium]|nr:carboxylate-amine ligase [Actinomycetota bacterium]MDQ6946781.1 carboxylate-amine ligase [Actinomycetota bacterium]
MALGTVGVEEEYQLLDADTGELRAVNDLVLDEAAPALGEAVHPELIQSQVEVSTPVCTSLDQLDLELRALRRRLNKVAARHGCRLGAAGTHPSARWESQEVTPSERYLTMATKMQQIALETLIFGCHVHIGIDDPELRINIMNRIRPWLPTLLALSANSPFWAGRDTGYASYRTTIFRRWPATGMPQLFSGNEEYEDVVETLVGAGAIEDASHLYWDVRPSMRFPTLEVRIADVCLAVDEAVTLAGLTAAMVATARLEAEAGRPANVTRQELLEAAVWRAARRGLTERLIDLPATTLRPAPDVVTSLMATLRPALEEAKTWDRVEGGVREILAKGSGATRQQAIHRQTGSLVEVAHFIADETGAG